MYGNFAAVYDFLMRDVDYKKWAEHIENIMKKKNSEVKNILELACGTGNLTIEFTEKGYDIAGIDISVEMLEVAREKAKRENLELVLLNQDMTELDFDLYDLDCVVCGCDGYNYVLDDEKIKNSFSTVYEILKPGGIFIFDISSGYKLREILGDNTFTEINDEVIYIWDNFTEEDISQMDLTFFVKEKENEFGEGLYRRFEETHVQRAYEIYEIEEFLVSVGFSDIEAFGDFTLDPPKVDSERIFFAAKK